MEHLVSKSRMRAYLPPLTPYFCRSQWPCGLRRGSWQVGCWDHGFESRLRHRCLSASFCVVLSCVVRGLATGWSLVQGVLPYVYIAQEISYMKGYKPEVTNPQNCKKLVSRFFNSKQRFILCQTWLTVTLTVKCCKLVNFSGTKIKGYFIFNITLKYLNFSMFWVSHLLLVTLHMWRGQGPSGTVEPRKKNLCFLVPNHQYPFS
jgi:hypothetical protein